MILTRPILMFSYHVLVRLLTVGAGLDPPGDVLGTRSSRHGNSPGAAVFQEGVTRSNTHRSIQASPALILCGTLLSPRMTSSVGVRRCAVIVMFAGQQING